MENMLVYIQFIYKIRFMGSREEVILITFSDNGLTSSTTNFKLVRYTTDLLNGTKTPQFLGGKT